MACTELVYCVAASSARPCVQQAEWWGNTGILEQEEVPEQPPGAGFGKGVQGWVKRLWAACAEWALPLPGACSQIPPALNRSRKLPLMFPSWGEPSLKGCIPGPALISFRFYSGKSLLEPLRSDLCRYPQLLPSLISESVVKVAEVLPKGQICSLASLPYLQQGNVFLGELSPSFLYKSVFFFLSLIIHIISSNTKRS